MVISKLPNLAARIPSIHDELNDHLALGGGECGHFSGGHHSGVLVTRTEKGGIGIGVGGIGHVSPSTCRPYPPSNTSLSQLYFTYGLPGLRLYLKA